MNPQIEEARQDYVGLLLRVGLFVLIGWVSLAILATLMNWIAGLLVTSVLSTFGAAALANAITVRVYERGRLSDLGLGWTETSGREVLTGIAAGAGAAILILGGSIAAGIARLEAAPGVDHPLASFAFVSVVLVFGAIGEEMLFHGYAFQVLIRRLGGFATILPASVVFGVAHLGNQNASIEGVLNTILWGILLGYAYYRTQALWMPIGLHFGWNFALPLFGANLSGFTMSVTGRTLTWRIGDLWSGGAYGPEGGLLTTMIVAVLFFAVRRMTPAGRLL